MKKQRKIFHAYVNLLESEIIIDGKEQHIIPFDELDEWNAITDEGQQYDIHLCYDQELTLSIYPVINGTADTRNPENWAKVYLYAKIGTQTFKLKNK
jgi:hypothetical protein